MHCFVIVKLVNACKLRHENDYRMYICPIYGLIGEQR